VRARLAGWALLAALAAPAAAAAGPRLAVEPESFDFGEARQERTLTKEFRLVNIGDQELVIERLSTSCGCTVVESGATTLGPGGSTSLRVEMQTRKERGPVVRTVLVQTNDSERPRVRIELRATVVAPGPEGR